MFDLSAPLCVLFLFISAVHVAVAWRFAGTTASSDPKIVGGRETTISEVPYLVNLRLKGRFICGGSLITSSCVLTAAHCVYGIKPTDLTVHGGSSVLANPGQVRDVTQTFVSPFYSSRTLDMDVAILKLSTPLSRDDRANIATIPLCSMKPLSGQLVQISGWGITEESSREPPNQVRTANVRVVPITDCVAAYAGSVLLSGTMFCATEPGAKDSCSGDSGGPAVYNGRVCGIVSWGTGCARPKYPGVYTNVSSRRVGTFLRQVMAKNC